MQRGLVLVDRSFTFVPGKANEFVFELAAVDNNQLNRDFASFVRVVP